MNIPMTPRNIPPYIPTSIPKDVPAFIPVDTPANILTNIPLIIPTTIPADIPMSTPVSIPRNIRSDNPVPAPVYAPHLAQNTFPHSLHWHMLQLGQLLLVYPFYLPPFSNLHLILLYYSSIRKSRTSGNIATVAICFECRGS